MAFTKAYAKILAGMLSDKALAAFQVCCGKAGPLKDVPEKVIDELIDLELVTRAKNFDGKELLLLTSRGKKVKEFV